MSKIYVAFMPTGARIASGSITTLRKRAKEFTDSQWSIYLYDITPNVDNIITMLEGDLSKLPAPEPIGNWRVTPSGQVRDFDPSEGILNKGG
jgi:hypothetical protein